MRVGSRSGSFAGPFTCGLLYSLKRPHSEGNVASFSIFAPYERGSPAIQREAECGRVDQTWFCLVLRLNSEPQTVVRVAAPQLPGAQWRHPATRQLRFPRPSAAPALPGFPSALLPAPRMLATHS